MNERFPVLSTVSVILRFAGWIAVAGGLLLVLNGVGRGDDAKLVMVGSGFAFSLWGLMIVAFGEAIGVLFAIEENTRTVRTPGGSEPRPDRRPTAGSTAPQTEHLPQIPDNLRESEAALALLRERTNGKAVIFASIRGDRWICVCGKDNPYDPSKRIQNCPACHTNRDFALENWSEEAMRAALASGFKTKPNNALNTDGSSAALHSRR